MREYKKLSNMTPEEKMIHKRKQKNEAQKRYYQKNKDYYRKYSKNNPYAKALKEQLDSYKRLVENLMTLELYEYELDYDYEEEPVDNYMPFDMKYYVNNWFEVEKIDREEE